MTWIKICGNTSAEDALAAVEAGADAVGVVFAPSPRRIDAETARAVVAEVPAGIEKVGVFVNETQEGIREVVARVGLTAVQLHGDESPEFVRTLFSGGQAGTKVFRSLPVAPGIEDALRRFAGAPGVDGILLDSAGDARRPRGGRGESFDWEAARAWAPEAARRVRVVLAGGLSPENVGRALRILEPWGVDVCSGVERCPGKKEPARMKEFVAAVRAAEKLAISNL